MYEDLTMAEERRKTIRIKKPLTAQYSYTVDGKQIWDMSLIKDLSESGICLGTNKIFPLNDIFFIRLKVPIRPSLSLEIYGRVVESREFKAGINITRVEFTDLKDEQKELLREYIAWMLVKERGGK
jgi:hypothetical protein